MIEATLKNYRQSPRKVRLVADLVRGKKVDNALVMLDFLSKKATEPVRGVLKLAIANAKNNFNTSSDKLYVKDIQVDGGQVMKRIMPRARGSAYPIKKRTSHIYVALDTKNTNPLTAVASKTESFDSGFEEGKQEEN
jgi:large subunit ribosomal protein L22